MAGRPRHRGTTKAQRLHNARVDEYIAKMLLEREQGKKPAQDTGAAYVKAVPAKPAMQPKPEPRDTAKDEIMKKYLEELAAAPKHRYEEDDED